PATIADNVGDNVGDVAGMGADLFESYAGSIIAPIALAAFAFAAGPLTAAGVDTDFQARALVFPLAIAGIGMVASIIGAFTVRSKANATGKELARSLHMGTNVAAVLTIIGVFAIGFITFNDLEGVDSWWGFPLAVVAGLLVG